MFLTSLLYSWLQLIHLLCVTSLYCFFKISIVSLPVCYLIALFSASAVSSSFSYATILFHQGFHCLIICLLGLRLCSVIGFDCFIYCLLCHYPISSSLGRPKSMSR